MKMIDAFPSWECGGGIFSMLTGAPWSSDQSVDVLSLDIDYYGNNSGEREASPLLCKFTSVQPFTELTDVNKTRLCNIIKSKFYKKWARDWALYVTENSLTNEFDYTEYSVNSNDETAKHSESYTDTHKKGIDITDETKEGTSIEATQKTDTDVTVENKEKTDLTTTVDNKFKTTDTQKNKTHGMGDDSGTLESEVENISQGTSSDNVQTSRVQGNDQNNVSQTTTTGDGEDNKVVTTVTGDADENVKTIHTTSNIENNKDIISRQKNLNDNQDVTNQYGTSYKEFKGRHLSIPDMIEKSRKAWMWNYFDEVYRDLDEVLTIPYWRVCYD